MEKSQSKGEFYIIKFSASRDISRQLLHLCYFVCFLSDSAVFFTQGNQRIGGTYLKAIYEEYTSSSFTIKKNKPAHLGFLGPVIRAEVGDVIEVVFKNNVSKQLQGTLSRLKYHVFMIIARSLL